MDFKIRKANEKENAEQNEDKKLIRIRFAFGKKEPSKQSPKPVLNPKKDDKRAIFSDERKEELINKLTSTSPRRKPIEPDSKRKENSISETDKLLRELADEFEVK